MYWALILLYVLPTLICLGYHWIWVGRWGEKMTMTDAFVIFCPLVNIVTTYMILTGDDMR